MDQNTFPRVVFAGTPTFAATILAAWFAQGLPLTAVYTQPDRPKGRGQTLLPSPVKEMATVHGVPVIQVPHFKDPEAVSQLAALKPDLLVVVAYGLILPQAVLDIPTFGCLNVHASLLPRWRGAAPIQHALLSGDALTGVALMQMEAGLDTGPVLRETPCPIEDNETYQSLHDKLAALGAELLIQHVLPWCEGNLKATAQSQTGVTYASKIQKADTNIDWHLPATTLERTLRAFWPEPGAHTTRGDTVLRVLRAEVRPDPASGKAPGTILALEKDAILVQTGNGVLALKEIQWPGKKPMAVRDFLNSKRAWVEPGLQFTSAHTA